MSKREGEQRGQGMAGEGSKDTEETGERTLTEQENKHCR